MSEDDILDKLNEQYRSLMDQGYMIIDQRDSEINSKIKTCSEKVKMKIEQECHSSLSWINENTTKQKVGNESKIIFNDESKKEEGERILNEFRECYSKNNNEFKDFLQKIKESSGENIKYDDELNNCNQVCSESNSNQITSETDNVNTLNNLIKNNECKIKCLENYFTKNETLQTGLLRNIDGFLNKF